MPALSILVTEPCDHSGLIWQLAGPHTDTHTARARLTEQISRTTAYAEQHHISLLDAVEALAAADAEDGIRIQVRHELQAPRCLTGPATAPTTLPAAA